jgi:hypothetical protein
MKTSGSADLPAGKRSGVRAAFESRYGWTFLIGKLLILNGDDGSRFLRTRKTSNFGDGPITDIM